MVSGVPSLFSIAQSVCIKLSSRITDVGDTPYHLVQPILKRLNAKQLALIEENSPTIMPHTDELWGFLIEKDFPDRPFNPAKLRLLPSGDNAQMPRRNLYKQYASEKEQFLATSADRLRRMTEKLRKEKSKNSITTVQGILVDPTIRRRNTQYNANGRGYNTQKARPTSILGKARRDVSQRSLMFGGAPKVYDPYKPFQSLDAKATKQVKSPTRNPIKKEICTSAAKKEETVVTGCVSQKLSSPPIPIRAENPPNIGNPEPESPRAKTMDRDISESAESSPISKQVRKRRPPPSIFLNQRKKARIPERPPAGQATKRAPNKNPSEPKMESRKPVRAIKSSIFN
ncbi:hypothetical protein OXX59_008201 [Metschnikowia pulcherrima]